MTGEEKNLYRRKRNGYGWLIAAAWWAYWLMQPNEGWGVAYAGGLIFALFTWPFAFLVSHYIARAMVESDLKKEAANQSAAEQQRRLAAQREADQRMRVIEDDAWQARQKIERGEFLKKLGSVRDYLTLLPTTAEPDRVLLIEQSIDKELRDLVIKYEVPAMSALIGSDDAVMLSVNAIVQTLEQRGQLSPDAEILKKALIGRTREEASASSYPKGGTPWHSNG